MTRHQSSRQRRRDSRLAHRPLPTRSNSPTFGPVFLHQSQQRPTILVKSCWESYVHHFTSHLIRLFELLAVLFGNWHVWPPYPIFNVGVLHTREVTIFFLENPTLIRGRGLSLKLCYLPNTLSKIVTSASLSLVVSEAGKRDFEVPSRNRRYLWLVKSN